MFREIKQSREDPKVLAAKAQEQYDKVLSIIVWLTFFLFVRGHMNSTLYCCGLHQISSFC